MSSNSSRFSTPDLSIQSAGDRTVDRAQLIDEMYSLFSVYNSGIGYISDSVRIGEVEYEISTYADGSMKSIIRNPITSGGLQENEATGFYYPVDAEGGEDLFFFPFDSDYDEYCCYCTDEELIQVYSDLRTKQGLMPISIQLSDEPHPLQSEQIEQVKQDLKVLLKEHGETIKPESRLSVARRVTTINHLKIEGCLGSNTGIAYSIKALRQHGEECVFSETRSRSFGLTDQEIEMIHEAVSTL